MKNCDEMVNSLLERRTEYLNEQKRKKKAITRILSTVCCICFVSLAAFGLWKSGIFITGAPAVDTGDEKDGDKDGIFAAGDDNSSGIFCGDYWVPENSGESRDEESFGASEDTEQPSVSSDDKDDICNILGSVTVNGTTYVESYSLEAESYTIDECIGTVTDYEGSYKSHLCDVTGKLFTVKETKEVLIAKLNTKTVVLVIPKE